MTRRLLILLVLFHTASKLEAQSEFPLGGYMSLEELRNKQPAPILKFQPVPRTKEEILYNGGNDYFMRCPDGYIDQKTIVTKLYAVSIGSALFLNTYIHELATGYAEVISEGRYLVFYSGFKDKKRRSTLNVAIAAGSVQFEISIPAATRAILANSSPPKRYLLVIDLKTGLVSLCDRNFLVKAIKPYPEIEYEYSMEPEQSNEQTLINYMQRINKADR